MCGIVGYIGDKNAIDVLLDGLKSLEYRGYDSSGIAFLYKNKIQIVKSKGKIKNLEKLVRHKLPTRLGIGHTRWATHGKPTTINAHPHKVGKFTIVHNGIIENYMELKNILINDGYTFKSNTDSEIICALIDKLYSEKNDILKVLMQVKNILIGSYALGIMCDDFCDRFYAIRKDSPLIVGLGKNENFIASDVPAILKYTKDYYLIEPDEIIEIFKDKVNIYNHNLELIEKNKLTFEGNIHVAEKNGYAHFMLKEIYEEPTAIKNTVDPFLKFGFQSLKENMPDFKKYNQIHIVACGSAYHAGLIGKHLIEKYGNIPVLVFMASEYRYNKNFIDKKTLIIFISQSGETADTLACLRKSKKTNDTLAIVNVIGSSIAREADKIVYTKAGPEIAVATTKAYICQLAVLSLIALNIAYCNKNINEEEFNDVLNNFDKLSNNISEILKIDYKKIAKNVYKNNKAFYIGRGIDYAIGMEGSLKLKEISYITSVAYPAGELKHGTISLIDKGTPVFAIITDKSIADKTISNIKEVKARGAKVILIISSDIKLEDNIYDEIILIPRMNPFINPILTIIPLQLLGYEIAKMRGCDIDKPKNLAKSVTVE